MATATDAAIEEAIFVAIVVASSSAAGCSDIAMEGSKSDVCDVCAGGSLRLDL